MRWPIAVLLAPALLAPALLAPPAAAQAPPGAVRIRTADGMELEAQWTPGREGHPGIVALHGEGADRGSWRALAQVRPEGWGLLAVDLRGFGGSRVQAGADLSERARSRDAALFSGAAEDALAALRWIREDGHCDPARLGLVGAGLGACAALEAAARDGKVAAVAALTPDGSVPGPDPLALAARWGTVPVLLVSTEEDAALGARAFAEAAAGKPAVESRTAPGRGIHGAGMLGRGTGLETEIVAWLRIHLARQILDGRVDPVESVNGASEDLPKPAFLSPKGSVVRARLDARFLNFSYALEGDAACPPKVQVVVTAPREENGARLEGKATVWGEATADGTFTRVFLGSDFFAKKPGGGMPDTALVAGSVLEARLPWTLFGVTPCDGMSVTLRCEAEAKPTTVMLQGGLGKKR